MAHQNFFRKMTALIALVLFGGAFSPAFAALPDTGQTKCYNDTVEITCPSPGQDYYGQDGNYTGNKLSYTKLDANGNALSDSATSWVMVKDNVTGLIWENKTADGSVHDASKYYKWVDALNVFIDKLNYSNFGGHNDWRLPTQQELHSIVDYSRLTPSINTGYFPNTLSSFYWSSSTYAGNTSHAWYVDFYNGSDYNGYKPDSYYVRAVRGGTSSAAFVDNGDDTVTDTTTGLMWQQTTGNNGVTMTWKAALAYCASLPLAGHTDWRLPNIRELSSLVDLSRYSPAIYPKFPNTQSSYYWSSSTGADVTSAAWVVDFSDGYGPITGKSTSYYVRAVRGGQPSLPSPTITNITPPSGQTAGGTPVTITGKNFAAGSTTVTFGESAATVSSVSATQIICTTPAHAAGAVNVKVTVVGTAAPATMLNGFTYTQPTNYTVTFQAGTGGSISGITSQTVNQGGNCSVVTATPNTGYQFVNWTGTGGFVATTANPLTVSNVTANMIVTANFQQVLSYTVNFTASPVAGGTVSSASQTVASGSITMPVTATANSGYMFSKWTDQNGNTVAATATLPAQFVTANTTYTANFTANTTNYTLNFQAGSGGYISGSASQSVTSGGNCTAVTAVPNSGYKFVNWTLSNGFTSATNPLIITNVTADMTLMANFQPGGVSGDVNGDGRIGLEDTIYILQVVAGLRTAGTGGDVNGNGNIGLEDAIYSLQIMAGLRP